jgi:hypothetical protein
MQILFDPGHPNSLLSALQQVQASDPKKAYELSLFEDDTASTEVEPTVVLWLVRHPRKIDPRINFLYEQGFRVFAIKRPAKKLYPSYELSVAILGLWPRMLEVLKKQQSKCIYTYHCESRKLIPTKQ